MTIDKTKHELYELPPIEPVLRKLQVQITGSPPDPKDFDLLGFLKKNEVLQPKFEANLRDWPDLIQTYIKKEILNFVREEKDFKAEDLEVINRFFETALLETEFCEGDKIPEDRWRQAMAALAQELRRYYGLEETDTELPCWRF